jgi:hypothetical protein
MTTGELPTALKLAREARVASNPMGVVTPHRLWKLSHAPERAWQDEQGAKPPEPPDSVTLYRHAMCEAGFVVVRETGEPYDPCPFCNWSPSV